LLKSELLAVTSPLAQQVAQMPGSATERPIDDKRLDYLKGQIMAGQATVFHWAIAVRPDETERRINGQHSSNILAKLNGDMPSGLMVNLTHYKVDDERDEILLFRQFDPKTSLRSRGDIAGAYQMMEEELRSVSRAAAKKAAEGIAWYLSRKVGVPVPKGDEVYDLFHQANTRPSSFGWKHPDDEAGIAKGSGRGPSLLPGKDPRRRKVSGATSAAAARNSPIRTIDSSTAGCRNENPKAAEIADHDAQLYQGCVFAWNAQRNGRRL
jgi:hypothetical protein